MSKPILMDFFADWCGPCRTQTPIIDALEKDFHDRVEFKKVNVDQETDLASKNGIFVVPTLVLEKDGVEVRKWIGVTSKDELTKALNETLK
ncbi:MAG: thioredoxin [Methanotrichaceae archaeon]|nr:thioredoxin [Methanotrichaceae archaeon]